MLSTRNRRSGSRVLPSLAKTPTGIHGLDQVTGGGLPSGRAALVCGGPGSGKTLVGLEFLIQGARRFGEPGLFVGFEETAEELAQNVASLGFDVTRLVERKLLAIDQVQVDRSEIEETGEYNLDGLFVRLDAAIKAVGARRVVIDTLETLFTSFDNQAILRAELARLFRWLKNRGITSIITAERGEGALTRHGLEEYVSDCVITLDHRTSGEAATRWLRVVKYRGSSHGTNDYPFLIDQGGVSVLPITAHGLDYPVSSQRVPTGVASLDEMMGGKGYFRGSSVLVSGSAGTGKTSLAAAFANATCGAGRRCLYVAFEEAMSQVVRNMRSTGLDLGRWIDTGLLTFHAARPSVFGLEMHLIAIHRLIEQFAPDAVILDPISSLVGSAPVAEVKSLLVRLLDYLKTKQVTGLFTSLATATSVEETEIGVSSLIDTWLQVRDVESRGERNRAIYVIKSRGMSHSNQVREFVITSGGIDLLPVQSGPDGVVIGSARLLRAAEEAGSILSRRQEAERRRRALRRRRAAVDSQIASLRAELAAEEEDLRAILVDEQKLADRDQEERATVERRRQGQDRTLRQPSLRAARRGRKS
jgi:circadian clock protein KaiC